MRYILRRERNLEFYISKSVGGSDTDVGSYTFCVYDSKFIDTDENSDRNKK